MEHYHYCRYCQLPCNCTEQPEYCHGCYHCYTGGDEDEEFV